MSHLDDGTLRRLLDEPQATLASARVHYAACDECQRRAAQLHATSRNVAQILTAPDRMQSEFSLSEALARTRARIAKGQPANIAAAPSRIARYVAPLIGLAAGATIVLVMIFTPLGTFAQGFLTIFEPHQFQPVAVTPMDRQSFRYLPSLEAYGTLRAVARPQTIIVAGPAQAASLARIPLRVPPAVLPANVSTVVHWSVTSPDSAMFTFSAAKARMAAATQHQALPPMPRRLDGSTLQVTIGPIVSTTFGGDVERIKRAPMHMHHGRPMAERDMTAREFPTLVIVQAPLPRVLSTGVSVREIEDYLLRQPGVPPNLAAQIAAIGDPTTTLPIPVPIDRASAQQVLVQGVRGLAIGDNTGVGAGVVWQRDGYIYGVAGPLPESEVLAIANSLR